MHSRTRRRTASARALFCGLGLASSAFAADSLSPGQVNVDRSTLHSIGVQWLIADDDNRNATVSLRYRKTGDSTWRQGLPLMRVWPETITVGVPQQFAGSIFDLDPAQSYEIELTATDPDGGGATETLTTSTRPVPRLEPATPNAVNVSSVAEFTAALAGAAAGDVIQLANGVYPGEFFMLNASGTADNPIVIRGESQSGVVLDGGDCGGCNVLEVYGSFVHVERLTLRNAIRGIRFQGSGTQNNVLRHVTIENVVHGVGSQTDQQDFTICDNTIEGRLKWPWTFDANATSHWDDRGVDITGDGHVVCHNLIRGFGDPVVNKKSQSRSWDVYGNDIYDSYDGTELDDGEGNLRLYHNRFTNVMNPVSIQPVWGGPAYVLRNVVLNAPEEPIKLKSTGGVNEPSGALIFHNTFVSPSRALNLQTPITQHNFRIENNLFIGPETLSGNRTVDWTAKLNGAVFDYNGYYPDGGFWFGVVSGSNQVYSDWAAVQAGGSVEHNGVLLATPIFAADFVGPADPQAQQTPKELALAASSNAIDRGRLIEGVNARHVGAAPDLGAWETGCPAPTYGPRGPGQDGLTNLIDCGPDDPPPTGTGGSPAVGGQGGSGASGSGGSSASGGGGAPGAGATAGDDSGCGCRVPGPSAPRGPSWLTWCAGFWVLARRMSIRQRD